jgi:lipoprotein-anchoring transpeptidase ErfK/SrfK
MWAAIRALIVVTGLASALVANRSDVILTAANEARDGSPVAAVLPARGATVGVAHPVVVTFRTAVADRQKAESALGLTSVPAMTGKFEWLDSNVVQWVPDRYWPAHSTVALSVGGLRTDFTTGPKVLGVADIANHTFTVTIDGVEAPGPLPAPHHRAHFGEAGVLPASMGRPEFPTPVGTYTVLSKDRSVVMDSSSVGIPVDDPNGYHLDVEYAVRISGHGLFVHSAPWAIPSMGVENVSHGCISLSPADAQWYFDNVHVGDPVVVKEGVSPVTSQKTADT